MKKKNSFEINSVNRHTSFAKIQEALKAIDDFEKLDPAVQPNVVHGLDHITIDLQRCLQTIKKIKEVLEE